MAEPTQPLHQLLEIGAKHTRMLAFIVAASIFAAGIFGGVYSTRFIAFIPLALVVPYFQTWMHRRLLKSVPTQALAVTLLLDGLITGFGIAALQYALVPMLVFIAMLNATVLSFGSLFLWIFTGFFCLLGALFGGLVLGLDHHVTAIPTSMTLVSLIGAALYFGFSSFHSREQSRALLVAKNQILQQQEEHFQTSRKLIKYLPPQVWESIFTGKRDARLQTQRKKLTIFFSDIKDFTETSDEMPPDALTEMLNTYFEHMSKIALRYGGTIDKFIGDAILIFYGDPTSRGAKEDATACVSMAVDMRREMQILRQKWQSMGIERPLHIRMGITTGYCHVGNFGSESRMSYTIIGRDANLAARLQSVASPDEILISHETYMLVRDRILCKEKGAVTLRGIAKPVQVWEVVDFTSETQETSMWVEHELNGFAMHMDINKIRNYDKERVIKALDQAAQKLKNTPIL
ncbi:MAG: adenylate/guanylate cyclase domain-containing protein [Fluviicoccus sp.]|uniref:adenylate/guanylate cyclase domain-containing protein n=1 Tax=Fluviicoccus sp. TaxID=2003552 RepID=UPI002728205D|nr:adenylate/guanylate cyclase domain-containing protein [Fluviicoccus sp.]MDO8328990.1 adenylate/guanylate cyclase domain-containing protein [Fluviicoccus sp.]